MKHMKEHKVDVGIYINTNIKEKLRYPFIQSVIDNLKFPDWSAFLQWKEREETETFTCYTKPNGNKESKEEGNYALHCFNNCRRGNYSALHLLPRQKGKGKSLPKEELPNPEAAWITKIRRVSPLYRIATRKETSGKVFA
jgi:hypothetical protein